MKKVFLVLILLFTLLSCGNEKILNIITSFEPSEAELYISQFEKETGISVLWTRTSAGEVYSILSSDDYKSKYSLWYGGTNTFHIGAENAELLESYKPKLKYKLQDRFHSKTWGWVGIYTGAIAFVSNTDFLKERNTEAPESWADLLKPQFKKSVTMAYPYSSGTAFTTWATIYQMMGQEDALSWWNKFNSSSIYQYTKSGSVCVTMAGKGETGIGIAFSHDIISKGLKKNYPLVMTFPKEGTGYEIGAVSLLKNAPEKGLAKIFINWALSKDAQNLFKSHNRIPVNPNAVLAEGAIPLNEIKLSDYDPVKAGKMQSELLEIWKKNFNPQ